jgi:hypothetical protein
MAAKEPGKLTRQAVVVTMEDTATYLGSSWRVMEEDLLVVNECAGSCLVPDESLKMKDLGAVLAYMEK